MSVFRMHSGNVLTAKLHVELVLPCWRLATVDHLADATQAPEVWGWLGLGQYPVTKYSPLHVLFVCVCNQALWIGGRLSIPLSGLSCFNMCHLSYFAWVTWCLLGQNSAHKNISQPSTEQCYLVSFDSPVVMVAIDNLGHRDTAVQFQSRHQNRLRSRRWLSSGHQYVFDLLQCFCLHPD